MGLQVTMYISRVSLAIGFPLHFQWIADQSRGRRKKSHAFLRRTLKGSGFPSCISLTTWPNPAASPVVPGGRQWPLLWHLRAAAPSLQTPFPCDFTIPYPGSGFIETAAVFPRLHFPYYSCTAGFLWVFLKEVHGAKHLGDVRLDRVQLYDCRTSWSPTYMITNSKAHIESLRVSPLFSVM